MLGVLHYLLILCFGIGQITSYEGIEGGCQINVSEPYFPFVIKPETYFLYHPLKIPDTLSFKYGEEVEFHCPGTTVTLHGKKTGSSWIKGTCVPYDRDGLYFTDEIMCDWRMRATFERGTVTCGQDSNLHYVTYNLGSLKTMPVFTVCFNKKMGIPLYTSYKLRKMIKFPTERRTFINVVRVDSEVFADGTDPISLEIYNQTVQKELLADSLVRKTYQVTQEDYLVPVFLTPPIDFLYRDTQDDVKRYINAVPQWRSVNSNHWKKLENVVQQCSQTFSSPLRIWTGIIQKTEISGSLTTYLHYIKGASMYPIPSLFWKLIYDDLYNQAIVLIVMNTPFEKRPMQPLCEDASPYTGWMETWDRHNVTKGYAFACSYKDFKNMCDYAPQLEVYGYLFCNI